VSTHACHLRNNFVLELLVLAYKCGCTRLHKSVQLQFRACLHALVQLHRLTHWPHRTIQCMACTALVWQTQAASSGKLLTSETSHGASDHAAHGSMLYSCVMVTCAAAAAAVPACRYVDTLVPLAFVVMLVDM
jgi:hypothetical protein